MEDLLLDTDYGNFYKLIKECDDTPDVKEKLRIVKELRQMLDKLTNMNISDKNYVKRTDLITEIGDHIQQTIQKTIDLA
jgi:hypothetical protein